ncbi:MAG: hypothetical protein ACE5LQ_02845 [Candidatus Bipolaricaulia bacterium]
MRDLLPEDLHLFIADDPLVELLLVSPYLIIEGIDLIVPPVALVAEPLQGLPLPLQLRALSGDLLFQ